MKRCLSILSLYSVTGNKITDFEAISGRQTAGQYTHRIQLNELGIAPGLYFLNFQGGDHQQTVKLSYIK